MAVEQGDVNVAPDDTVVEEEVAETAPAPASRKLIYAYTVPGRKDEPWERPHAKTHVHGTGLLKVGQTTKPTARQRVREIVNQPAGSGPDRCYQCSPTGPVPHWPRR